LLIAAPLAVFAQTSSATFDLGKAGTNLSSDQIRSSLTMVASWSNNAWLIVATALVFFMTIPGLALFYGGLVRKKNILSVLMQSFGAMAIVSIVWVTIGFSLAFSPTELIPGILGDFKYAFMNNLGSGVASIWTVSQGAAPVNSLVFVMFQCMFAVITPALIIGAFAERFKFSHYIVFTIAWIILVYAPVAHAVWSPNGILFQAGALDFAGGTVVHMNAGISGLVAAIVLGKRSNKKANPPHNLVFTVVGAAMLWFGWFGFNAGSGLAADGIAGSAFLMTNTATAMAAITWFVLDWIFHRKPTVLGAATGAVAGLVAITPAAGFVSLPGALAIGILVSLVCYFFVVKVKEFFKYDDTLDCFGVHGIGGMIGSLGTGLFADPAVWKAFGGNYAGLFYGNAGQMLLQLEDIGYTVLVAGVGTFIIMGILKLLGAKADNQSQAIGLDVSDHNERAYTVIE
jgi:Amt family ammonium transporter